MPEMDGWTRNRAAVQRSKRWGGSVRAPERARASAPARSAAACRPRRACSASRTLARLTAACRSRHRRGSSSTPWLPTPPRAAACPIRAITSAKTPTSAGNALPLSQLSMVLCERCARVATSRKEGRTPTGNSRRRSSTRLRSSKNSSSSAAALLSSVMALRPALSSRPTRPPRAHRETASLGLPPAVRNTARPTCGGEVDGHTDGPAPCESPVPPHLHRSQR